MEMIAEEAGQAKKAVVSQVTGKQGGQKGPTSKQSSHNIPASQGVPPETTSSSQLQDDPTKTFVKDLYGNAPDIKQAEREKREMEDKQKLEELRQRLHSEYYQRLTTPPKQQGELRPAEKLEQEEKEEEQKELEEKEKEPKDLPVVATKNKGTKEKLRGVSG